MLSNFVTNGSANIICRYLWLFKISYLYYAPIGFCITFFSGWLFSLIFDSLGLGGIQTIYLNGNPNIINPDLFSPPIANRIRRCNAKYLEDEHHVSNVLLQHLYFISL